MNETIAELIEQKKFAELKPLFVEMEAEDIAQIIDDANPTDMLIIFRILPKELAAETFVELDTETQEQLINCFSDKELQSIISELFVDDTVDIIEEMPANVVNRILKHVDADMRKDINEILKYAEDSAGSIMTTEYITLRPQMNITAAHERIRTTGVDMETINTCYVTDNERRLIGYMSIRMLLLAEPSALVRNIMESNCIYVETGTDKEDVAKVFTKYGFVALPVVDNERRLVGIITVDDAMNVIEEEATEDIQLMAAVSPLENGYMETSVFRHYSKRIVWLFLLMISGILTGLLITRYEEAFLIMPLLVAFIPRLMDTGGNCGSQTSAVVIRSMALDEIGAKEYFKVLSKEMNIALLVGATLGALNVPLTWILYGASHPSTVVWYLCLAFGLTLLCVVLISKFLGCTLPMLAKLCKLDPALLASPIITTIVDVSSIAVYFMFVKMLVLPHVVI